MVDTLTIEQENKLLRQRIERHQQELNDCFARGKQRGRQEAIADMMQAFGGLLRQ